MRVYQIGEFHGDVIHQQTVNGVVFAITRRKRGETVPQHTHNHASIRALISGNHHYIADSGNIRHSIPGAWYFAEANQIHTHEACQTDIVSIGIQYEPESYPVPTVNTLDILKGPVAVTSLNLLKEHLANPRHTSNDILSSVFDLLRASLADETQTKPVTLPAWASQLKMKLDSQYLVNYSIEELAKELSVHPSHMARVFRAEFGQTITAYIRDRRLEWSISEMKSTTQKLGVIAVQAGFADQAHFSREFKKRYGTVPSNYRS